jgi:hypothetical protein
MAYISPNDPLPRNSADGITACEASRAASIVNGMEQSVANARAASASIAGPQSFAQFGPAVVIDVQQQQNGMFAANQLVPSQTGQAGQSQMSVAQEIMSAPRVLPLNVTEDEYGSCCTVKGPVKPMQIAPQVLTMPKRMPAPMLIPSSGMAGYRAGMGAPWGDAGSMPSTAGWPPYAGVNWKWLALFAVAVAGLYVADKR